MELNLSGGGFHRTRLAPTPSGYLHHGNALSFALTASIARLAGAAVLLRVDDMDAARVRPEYVKDIFSTLRFLGIPWQEGPRDADELFRTYSQYLRMPLYESALNHLRLSGAVFACTCSRSSLAAGKPYPGTCRDKGIPLDTANASWRLRTDMDEQVSLKILTGGRLEGPVPDPMQDFVVRKKDGAPAYQLTSVADDEFFQTDLIVRGDDLRASSIAQGLLARRLNYEGYLRSAFYFHPLICDQHGRKLSKSAGDLSIGAMIKPGTTRSEIYRSMGAAAGIRTAIDSWEPLAEFFLQRSL